MVETEWLIITKNGSTMDEGFIFSMEFGLSYKEISLCFEHQFKNYIQKDLNNSE